MKARRAYLFLAFLGLLLLGLDAAQRWLYVACAPPVPSRLTNATEGPLTRAILVAGQGLDEAESATSRRDVVAATQVLQQRTRGRLEVLGVSPGESDFSNERVLGLVSESDCDHLIVFLTGHGGGRNFGAVGGLNLTRDRLAETVSRARFQRATIVLDFCWSGEFGRSFADHPWPASLSLITSTDARHPCPFPVSFLSPHSFGRTFFEQWNDDAKETLRLVNERRGWLRYLYPSEFGLKGELWSTDGNTGRKVETL